MAVYSWPDNLIPQVASLTLRKLSSQFASPLNGTLQTMSYVGEQWILSVSLPPKINADAGVCEAFWMRLSGGVDRVRAWHFATKGVPRGTLRGSPTLAFGVSRGATSITINNVGGVGSGATLLAGDMIGLPGHLFMVAENCAESGGAIVVPLVNRVRSSIAGNSAVAWNRPTAEFILPGDATSVRRPGYQEGIALDLEEQF
ncbi:MAG: hypothetical protein ACRCV9_18470 [Burkholderiaceae bacterium]